MIMVVCSSICSGLFVILSLSCEYYVYSMKMVKK